MRPAQLAAALLPVLAATGTNGPVSEAALAFPTAADAPLILPRAPAQRATVVAGEQDPSAVEASLGLDRSTRRLIQRGLRNEGFDPGAPDGLFGPRTRAAIRAWQAARQHAETGYLNRDEAEVLRAAGAPPAVPAAETTDISPLVASAPGAETGTVQAAAGSPASSQTRDATAASPLAADSLPAPAQADAVSSLAAAEAAIVPAPVVPGCNGWNTEEFFETATVEEVTACLATGADVGARDDNLITPLHWAAWSSRSSAVIDVLIAAGADLEARNDAGRTPLHNAASNDNVAVFAALLAAGADLEAGDSEFGATALHLVAAFNDHYLIGST